MIQPIISSIREKRIKSGFSMRSLATKAKVHYATISNLERHGHNVSPSTAKALCDALNAHFDDLFIITEETSGKVIQEQIGGKMP